MNPSGLKRSGTLQAPISTNSQASTPPDTPEGTEEEEYAYETEDPGVYDDEYRAQQYSSQGQQYAPSPIGRQSPWAPANEWRTAGSGLSSGSGHNSNVAIDDVQRALSALELASNNGGQNQMYQAQQNVANYQAGQSAYPPRFNPAHPPPSTGPGMRNYGNGNGSRASQFSADVDGRKTPQSQGGSYMQQQYQQDNRAQSAGGSYKNKDRIMSNRTSNPNLQYGYQQGGKGTNAGVPSVPAIPQQYLQQQSRMSGGSFGQNIGQGQGAGSNSSQSPEQSFVTAPIDVPSLIATKGYNPTNFDIRPPFVRHLNCASIWL